MSTKLVVVIRPFKTANELEGQHVLFKSPDVNHELPCGLQQSKSIGKVRSLVEEGCVVNVGTINVQRC